MEKYMYESVRKMLSLAGKTVYKPNMMVLYSEKMQIPVSGGDGYSRFHGLSDMSHYFGDENDERGYERTILRHSTFFDRMRVIRSNVRRSTPYILGETTVSDIPDVNSRHEYTDAMFDCFVRDGREVKWLCIPTVGVIEFYSDGTVLVAEKDEIIPYIGLEDGKCTASTVSPMTDALSAHGRIAPRLTRAFLADNVSENLSFEGGRASFRYVTLDNGNKTESVDISLEMFPSADAGEELDMKQIFDNESDDERAERERRDRNLSILIDSILNMCGIDDDDEK